MFEKHQVKFTEVEIDGEKCLVKGISAGDSETIFSRLGCSDFAAMNTSQQIAATSEFIVAALFAMDKKPVFTSVDEVKSLSMDGVAKIGEVVFDALGLGESETKKNSQKRKSS